MTIYEDDEDFDQLPEAIKEAVDQAAELNPEEPIYFAYCLLVKNQEAFTEVLNEVQQNKLYFANGSLFEDDE